MFEFLREVPVPGSRLAFERHGNGPPVALLHGIGHDRHAWDPVVGLLTPDRDLVLVDLPGHGASPMGTGVLGVAELTGVVEQLLSELGLDRPIVVGDSLGGAIALELARRGRARAVVALSPIGFRSRWEVHYVVAVLRIYRALAPLLLRWPAAHTAALGVCFARPERFTADDAARTPRAFAEAAGIPAILPHSRHYRFRDPNGIDQKTVTIAWGTRDRLLRTWQFQRARELLRAARHVPLPGAGHVPMLDAPAEVAGLILAAGRRTS